MQIGGLVSFEREYPWYQLFYMQDQILGKKNEKNPQFSDQNLILLLGPPLPKYKDVSYDQNVLCYGPGIAKILLKISIRFGAI